MKISIVQFLSNAKVTDVVHWLVALSVAMIPMMTGMASPVGNLPLSDFVLLFFAPISFYYACYSRNAYLIKTNYSLLFFLAVIILLLPICNSSVLVGGLISVFLLVILLCAYYSDFYRKKIVKAIIFFSVLASFLIIIQYIGFYFFGKYITYIPYFFYKNAVLTAYELFMTTGLDNSFFRPSAIFLEPGIMSRYCVLGLYCVLFEINMSSLKKIFLSFFITAGTLMSTSGMGIVFLSFVWFSFYLKKSLSSNIDHAVRYLVVAGILLYVVAILFNSVEMLNNALSRISGSGLNGYNAVEGRFAYLYLFSEWNVSDWIFGRGINSEPSVFFTGLMTITYRWGVLGLVPFVLSFFEHQTSGYSRSLEQWSLSFLVLGYFAVAGLFSGPNIVLYLIVLNHRSFISQSEKFGQQKLGFLVEQKAKFNIIK